jgi:hypothetical protein
LVKLKEHHIHPVKIHKNMYAHFVLKNKDCRWDMNGCIFTVAQLQSHLVIEVEITMGKKILLCTALI